MSFAWVHENPPHWDANKAEIVGGAPDGIFHLVGGSEGQLLPGEWWRVEDDGSIVGYGWMDCTWAAAEILLAVAANARTRGVGTFILDRLEREAASRGLNYMYNIVHPSHPDRKAVTRWLRERRFEKSHDDDQLVRRVLHAQESPS